MMRESGTVTNETDNQARHSAAWYVGLVLFAAIIVYPLSLGPAAFVYFNFGCEGTTAGAAIEAVYFPLETFSPEPVRQALTKYVELFKGLAHKGLAHKGLAHKGLAHK
jgi:hypothetical protein